ncbi:MAG: polyprenyl synthetase family protein [Caldiserica bacterium]|jgi:geranylgeranyl pyrophosphate synthase|nr:polyprenyl synthetase family protein [Caldisericota bacterium]
MIEEILEKEKEYIDQALLQFLKEEAFEPATYEMVSYPLLSSGKRLRPILVLWACDAFLKPRSLALKAACGIECLHAFSLVHDDLPGMDNSDTRRGKPSVHKAFGVGNAILVGDALLCLGIKWIAEGLREAHVPNAVEIVAETGDILGIPGLIGGQFEDIALKEKTLEEWIFLYERKTARLFQFSLKLGAWISGANESQIKVLYEYGRYLGIAFQLIDDIMDFSKDEPSLAKAIGREMTRKLASNYVQRAISALDGFKGNRERFECLVKYLEHRNE